jgi:NitT/TauT family transport system permease protein
MIGRWLSPAILIAVLLTGWEAACRLLHLPAYVLPPPSAVVARLASDAPTLLIGAWNTLSMALCALALASVAGCGLALITALSPALERAVRPLAVAAQVTPVVAVAPLFLIWSGLDHPARAIVALAAIVAFFPIFSGASAGLKSADPGLERLFDLYGSSHWQRLVRLRLPAATPFLLEGHRVAAGLAVIGAVVAEFVAGSGATQGLAWRILESGNRLQTDRMFAALAVLAAMGLVLHGAVQALERRLLAWWSGSGPAR